MSIRDQGRGCPAGQPATEQASKPVIPWYGSARARVGAALVGSAAAVVAAVIAAGAPLASSPVASAGPKPTATVSGAADPDTKWQYYESLGAPYNLWQDGLKSVAAALDAGGDVATMQRGCQQLRSAGARFEELLPSPDSKATPRLQALSEDLNAAANACMGFGPGTGWDDIQPMMTHIDDAETHLKGAKQALLPYS